MKVRMLVHVSGGRGDGAPWPEPGEVLEVDDAEGAALCAAGLAQPVAEERKVETPERPLEEATEKRAAPARAPSSRKQG